MTANIIETNSDPFETAEVDPVTLDIIENALRNARMEMDATVFRTAMSPGIREQGDAFPLIADRNGKMIVGQFGSFIDGFINAYEGDIEEGDIAMSRTPSFMSVRNCEPATRSSDRQSSSKWIRRRWF